MLCKGGILIECDINKDKVVICVMRIASITSLKSRVTQENTLRGFGQEFVLYKSKNINKTNTTKEMREKAEKKLGENNR